MSTSAGSCITFNYACIECGAVYPVMPGRYLCDQCAPMQTPDQPLRGQLELRLDGDVPEDWARLKQNRTGFSADFRSLMPVPGGFFPPIPVGGTPLWEPQRLRTELGLDGLFLKDDTLNPTGSLKDRASCLVAAFARQHGLNDIVLASTGNAGSSMAGIAAAAGLRVRLFLPASAPQAKRVQAAQYGALITQVDGSYDDAYDASLAYIDENGGLSRNTAHNPLTVEGKKSAALEVFQQLGASVPDIVYVPVGDGVILSGVYKGFEDLMTLGLTSRIPEVVSVQAESSDAISRALKTGTFGPRRPARTVADSISVDVPRGGLYALARLQKHGGRSVTVSDEAIIESQRRLSAVTGLFAEPAAAAAFAGLLADRAEGRGPGSKDRVVLILTGNGLKDIAAAARGIAE